MKAEVMRCIWKSMKACKRHRGQGYKAAVFPDSSTSTGPGHLLQYSLLGEVELLEAVILIIAGGVKVMSVHLGTR